MTKLEIITAFTSMAGHYEKNDRDMLGKIIYETLAAAKDSTPEAERKNILTPLVEVKHDE